MYESMPGKFVHLREKILRPVHAQHCKPVWENESFGEVVEKRFLLTPHHSIGTRVLAEPELVPEHRDGDVREREHADGPDHPQVHRLLLAEHEHEHGDDAAFACNGFVHVHQDAAEQ